MECKTMIQNWYLSKAWNCNKRKSWYCFLLSSHQT